MQDSLWSKCFHTPIDSQREVDTKAPGYTKYLEYTLTREELKSNKYPQQGYSICASYQNTEDWPLIPNREEKMKVLSIDCEMVETNVGYELARISVINLEYESIYECLVKPSNKVVNYHTK